jgi:hypothetical protein
MRKLLLTGLKKDPVENISFAFTRNLMGFYLYLIFQLHSKLSPKETPQLFFKLKHEASLCIVWPHTTHAIIHYTGGK